MCGVCGVVVVVVVVVMVVVVVEVEVVVCLGVGGWYISTYRVEAPEQ